MIETTNDQAGSSRTTRAGAADVVRTRPGFRAADWLRRLVAAAAAFIVVWSFVHVLLRTWRGAHALPPGTVEITLVHWGDRDEDAITQALVDSFHRTHTSIRIRRINAGANYYAKLQTMIASGDPPDLFFLNSNNVPKYAGKGLMENLDPLIRADIASGKLPFSYADMYPQALNSFRFDGVTTGSGPLFGLPMSFTPMGFYVNTDLFRAAGVELPRPGWTWTDFARTARELSDFYRAQGRSDVVGAALDLRGGEVPRLMLWTYGTDLVTPDWMPTEISPAGRAALDRLTRWSRERDVIRVYGDPRNEIESGSSRFLAGKAGLYGPIGRWMVPTYRTIEDFAWDYADLPRGEPEQGGVAANMLYVAAWCISSGSRHKAEAWEVARHFATAEAQGLNSRLGLALPTLKSVAESEAFLTPGAAPASGRAFLDAIPASREMGWPVNSQLFGVMKNAVEACYRTRTIGVDEMLAELRAGLVRLHEADARPGQAPLMPWRALILGLGAVMAAGAGAGAWWWRRTRPGKLGRANERAGLLMASPWLIGLTALFAGPMLVSLALAFSSWSGMTGLGEARWTGLENFRVMWEDPRWARSVVVTAAYAALAVPLGQTAALLAALLMARPLRGINIFRTLWYLPTVLAGVAMGVMWWWVFDADNGLVNMLLRPVLEWINGATGWALRAPAWFGEDARLAGVPAFAVASLWTAGGTMLVYLAGLLNIPRDLYEAAELDGAGSWRKFRNVTLPMLSPVILFNLVIAIIGSFQVFTLGYVMTKGGPADATLFYVLYLYEHAFEHHEMGYASALAWVLFVIVLGLTLVMLKLSRSRVHYEGGTA